MSEKKLKQLRKLTGFKAKGQEPKFKRVKISDAVKYVTNKYGFTKAHTIKREIIINLNKVQYTLDKKNYKQKVG